LEQLGIATLKYEIVADEIEAIRKLAIALSGSDQQLLIFTGGTGLSSRDVTPEAITPLMNRPIDGIMETARRYGQERMPFAMLSRGVAGFIDDYARASFAGIEKWCGRNHGCPISSSTAPFKINKGQKH